MSEHDSNDSKHNHGGQRIPSWAGHVLIASDMVRRSMFLVPWLGTLIALYLVLPTSSLWIQASVLVLASIATLVAVVRAAATQAAQRGALGAYVAHLATQTMLGRWLTDLLSNSSR
ncbi:hypothetical protein V5738_01885 [Salinisphaera sp. SPP-AMP-43]|uniref:hypothetical protein n=1 Tax=Salinisphaera sp. SPP-AMP-43 TaxID=3121288 RepID=UPI003C6E414F